jgi:hypothetical protein
MRMNRLTYLFISAICIFTACKEEPPFINYQPKTSSFDSTYIDAQIPTAQAKGVLLEDITGVSCINCPEAATIAKNIIASNPPGRVCVVAIQPKLQNIVTKPTPETRNDNRTDKGTIIVTTIKEPGSLPRGYIDRKVYAPNPDPTVERLDWPTKVSQQLALTTPVNISLITTYSAGDASFTVDVKIQYTQAVTDSNYLSLVLIEDSVIDAQEYPTYVEKDYVHMHLFRDMLTAPLGDQLNGSLIPGRTFVKRYPYKIPAAYVAKNLKIVAFVHKNTSLKEVLHSVEKDVTE